MIKGVLSIFLMQYDSQPFSNLHRMVLKLSGEYLQFSSTNPSKPTFVCSTSAADQLLFYQSLSCGLEI